MGHISCHAPERDESLMECVLCQTPSYVHAHSFEYSTQPRPRGIAVRDCSRTESHSTPETGVFKRFCESLHDAALQVGGSNCCLEAPAAAGWQLDRN